MRPYTLLLYVLIWLGLPLAMAVPAHGQIKRLSLDKAQTHWAFRPIAHPTPPDVSSKDPLTNPIDRFVLTRLKEKGLSFSPPANRQTLIRRVSYDLTGLPPTPAEVATFVGDSSAKAYENLVDRLLASPRYGQRWGRHWLDVARYSDTMGYLTGNRDTRYAFSYTYRDYVIEAFNKDLPYNRFILEQLAADQLELGKDKKPLAAMGFLTVGRRFIGNIHNITDDRIDVVSRGLIGLTLSCARCHDHKYDPLNMADYYGWYGIMRSSHEPKILPVIDTPTPGPAYEKFKKELAKRENDLTKYRQGRHKLIVNEVRSRAGDYLLYVARTSTNHKTGTVAKAGKRGAFRRRMVDRWAGYLSHTRKTKDPVFSLWHMLIQLPAKNFAATAKQRLTRPEIQKLNPNPLVLAALQAKPIKSIAHVAEVYGKLLEDAHAKWKKEGKNKKALANPRQEQLRQALYGPRSPTTITFDQAQHMLDQGEGNQAKKLSNKITAQMISAGSPPRAMVMADNKTPFEPRIFARGNTGRPEAKVPRRFVRVLEMVDGGKAFAQGSGRLELAQAVVHPNNPLTTRVLVNRVWSWHFGKGLVHTLSDFGSRAEPPSHPQLLDWLARDFMAKSWSVKKLNRLMVLSKTYRQSSIARTDGMTKDPINRLFWRMNRQRISFEQMHDALLLVAGRLDEKHGGRSINLFKKPYTTRRAVYGLIDRQKLAPTLRIFDFANPDASVAHRPNTTVPQQALYMMNGNFVMEQAAKVLQRPEIQKANPTQRVDRLYRTLFGRAPTSEESATALAFVASPPPPAKTVAAPIWDYGYARHDAKNKKLRDFRAMPYFGANKYQGSSRFPDPKLQYLLLTATGGHVGVDQSHVAVRRWTSPITGSIRIEGTIGHKEKRGDGVRATIFASRGGQLGQWVAHNDRTSTTVAHYKVTQGETICFSADARKEHSFDSFDWAPIIKQIGPGDKRIKTWSAGAQFTGPVGKPATPPKLWAIYIQALLQTNEFVFVD
jgi:hypothetical protein